jgi:hypothetical protein
VNLHVRKGLVHAIADCTVCGKHWENYLTAQKNAAQHTRKTGHKVIVDLGYSVDYTRKKSSGDGGLK